MNSTDQRDESASLPLASAELDAELADLALRHVETIARDMVGAQERIDAPELRNITQKLYDCDGMTKTQEKVAVRVVKELARIIAKAVAAATLDSENVKIFIHLDDNLTPLMEFIVEVANKFEAKAKVPRNNDSHELLRWTPFVVHAATFFNCAQLPAYDAMRCTQLAGQATQSCQRLHQVESQSELLGVIFDRLVALTSQEVSKDVWVADHSAFKHVLAWVVQQVTFPHFGGEVLGRVLSLVFPLVDDLTDATQLAGARMLLHIVRNITDTELRWYKDVLLEVLRGAITTRKPATLDCLVEALVLSLDKLSAPGDFQYYDTFFPRLLNDCSLNSEVAVRELYTRHFRVIIQRLGAPHGIYVIRFLQPLLKLLVASFDSVNASLVIATLETLRVTVVSAWPRIPAHAEQILVGVLKAVALCEVFQGAEAHMPTAQEKEHILTLAQDVVRLLMELDRPHVTEMLQRVAKESHALKPFTTRVVTEST